MKKILFVVMFMLSGSGVVQAANIDGQAGVDKHTVVGLGMGDFFVAQSQGSDTTVTLTDVATPVTSSTSNSTTGLADGFIHDYVFNDVQDTIMALTTAIQLSIGDASKLIQPLIIQVWHILESDPDVLLDSATLDVGVNPGSNFTVQLVAGDDYVVRMSNQGGTIGDNADYTLNVQSPVSAVPVPAAVWLFGTAMMGLLGLRRKSRMAVAA
jgi:hypothetical protein